MNELVTPTAFPDPPTKGARLLYVDDEENNLLVFKATFRLDYHILTATSAREGLRLLSQHPVDLIITDQKMPDMNGVEFLKQVMVDYPQPVRIILTGYSDIISIVTAINECGIYRYLTKPWSEEEMRLTIEKGLENHRLRRENDALLQHLENTNQTLESRVKQRTTELQTLNEDKNHLIGLVAHDLRSPLNRILGLVDLMELTGENLTDEQRSFLELMREACQKNVSMIKKILDVEAIETGRYNTQIQAVVLNEVVNELLANCAPVAQSKDIRLELDADPAPVVALADRSFYAQAIENLLSNAVKFSPVRKTIFVRLSCFTDATGVTWARTQVQDQGPGITADDMPRLFGKFQRLAAQPTGGESSTGLGLSIVKRFVETMNGRIHCESQPGQGATFVVELPTPA